MKTTLLFAVLLVISTSLPAQITVTNTTFPVAGDTLKMAIDYTPGTIGSITPPGTQNWDFTGLQVEGTQNTIYRPASEGSMAAQVPGATLFTAPSSNSEEYYKVTSTTVELMAYNGPDPYGIGVNGLFEYNPPLAERWAPLNFFDIRQASSGILRGFKSSEFPPGFLSTMPVSADSFRYRISISLLAVVDAWGSMSIPGGTYDVLREKRTFYRESRMDAKVPPLGWLDVTDVVIQNAGITALGVDTIVSYHFYNDVSKEPIAIVTLDNNQAFATQIMFKNTTVVNGLTEASAAIPSVTVLPNPVSDEAVFSFKNFAPDGYRLAIFDKSGRLTMEKSLLLNSVQTERVNLAGLSPGMYFYSVFNENKRVICRGKLVKKPA
jgi:hypothetical protein